MKHRKIIFFIKLKFIVGRRKNAWVCMPLHSIYCDECIWTQNFKIIQNVLKWCENSFGIIRKQKKRKGKKNPSPILLPRPAQFLRPSPTRCAAQQSGYQARFSFPSSWPADSRVPPFFLWQVGPAGQRSSPTSVRSRPGLTNRPTQSREQRDSLAFCANQAPIKP